MVRIPKISRPKPLCWGNAQGRALSQGRTLPDMQKGVQLRALSNGLPALTLEHPRVLAAGTHWVRGGAERAGDPSTRLRLAQDDSL